MFDKNREEEFIQWPIALKKHVDSKYYKFFKMLNEKHYRKAHDHLFKKVFLNHKYCKNDDKYEKICQKCSDFDNLILSAYVLGSQVI